MATIEEIYKKRGIEYKPMPTGIREESSTQKVFLEISAKREQRKREGIFTEAQKSYEEAQKAASLKSIVKETILGIPEAIPKTFKVLATPEGVKSLGRGYIKGLSLGYIAPETPEEASEVEKAIEAGWEAAGFFTTFLGGEAALNLAFKTPVIAAKLGKSAPYIARASAWLGTSQLHKELRGAEFEERAKQAAIDAAMLLVFEGIAYGVGKGITRFKMGKVPPAVHQKGIKYFHNDLKMKFGKTGINIPEMVKITEGIDLSKAKTITEALKIYKSKLSASWLKNPKVRIAIDEAFGTVKSAIFEISKKEVHPLMARFKLPKAKPGVKVPEFMPKPVTKPPKFRVSLKAEMAALKRIQRDFPGIKGITTRISTIEKEIAGVRPKVKVPKAEISELKISKVLPEVSKKPYVVSYKPSAKAAVVKEKFWSLAEAKMRVSKIKMVTMKVKAPPPLGVKPIKVVKLPKERAPEMRELAYYSERFRKPRPSVVKEETDKLIRRSEIAKTLAEKLDVPIRRGKFRIGWGKQALGVYKPTPKIIRIKKGGIPVIAHEVGHYLDDIIGFSKAISKAERKKLLMEYGGKPKGRKATKEAFAEFLRFYVTEPSKAKAKAPIFSEYFRKAMEKQPEIKEVLLQARKDYERWFEMPAMAKVLSQIAEREEKLGIKQRIMSSIDQLYIELKDEAYPIKLFSALAKEKLGDIPKKELPYILVSVLRGWVGKAETFLTKGTFNKVFWTEEAGKIMPEFTGKSLKNILKPIEKKGALSEFEGYLTSKRAIVLNRRKIDTGIATEDAVKAISQALKKYPEFTKTSQELYKFQDAILKYGYQSGLFDVKTLIRIKTANPFYVPFYRVQEVLQSRGYYGKGYVNISNKLKRVTGSEREILPPLESIVKNTYAIMNAADRNAVGIQMANLAARNPELGRLFEKISVPVAKVARVNSKELKISLTGLNPKEIEAAIDIFRPSLFLPSDNVLVVLIKGKKHYFQVEPMLYKALTTTEKEHMGMTVNFLSHPTRWLRAGAILTPEFMMRNPQRDMLGAFVFSKYGFMPPIDFIRGLFGLVKKDKDYWLWRMAGGEHSMFVSMDRKYLQKNLDEIIRGKGYKSYVKNPLEPLRALAEMSEVPCRLGEFKKGIVRMKEPIEVGHASRDIVLDFTKMGNTGRVLNRLIAFWNAWAEGWDKLIREFKHHPTRITAKAVSGLTIPSIILYSINRDNPHWKETPQWLKDTCWLIPIGEKFPYFIPIRKPFQLGIIFATIPERVLQYIDEKDPIVMKNLAENILAGQIPGIMPTAFQPLIENWSNYSFFLDRPIVPISREALPEEAQYTAYTSEVAKILGKTINYSPAKIDNLFRGYFAGLGSHIIDTIDGILIGTGISSVIKPEPTLADKPVVKAFVTRRPIGSASESVNRFYEKYQKYESREKMLKEFLRNNEKEKFYAYKEKFPELYFTYDWERKDFYSIPARYYRKVARQIAELRKKEQQIYVSKTLSPEEKRERIDKINELITKVAQKALEFDLRR